MATANEPQLQPKADRISPAEARVLRQLHRGLSNRGIAAALVLSVRTVESHISNLLEKSGCHNRTQLLLWALGVNAPGSGDKLRTGSTLPA
jgi:DNA-binding NarL/FixJ family response regulator